MSVNNADKAAMANILANLGGFDDPLAMGAGSASMGGEGSVSRAHVSGEETNAMKKVLENMSGFFSAMEGTVDNLQDQAETYPELKAAMVTERTSRGARVGSWEIVKHNGSDFDVVHVDTGEPIAKSLKIYEAAFALAKALNSGRTLTDEPVRKILALESQYAQHLDKATHYKHMAQKLSENGETKRAAIAEDRFDVARDSALDERERILKLSGLR